MIKVKIEKNIYYCKECPFCHYESGSPHYYECTELVKELSYGAIIENPYEEIHSKCPFRESEEE